MSALREYATIPLLEAVKATPPHGYVQIFPYLKSSPMLPRETAGTHLRMMRAEYLMRTLRLGGLLPDEVRSEIIHRMSEVLEFKDQLFEPGDLHEELTVISRVHYDAEGNQIFRLDVGVNPQVLEESLSTPVVPSALRYICGDRAVGIFFKEGARCETDNPAKYGWISE